MLNKSLLLICLLLMIISAGTAYELPEEFYYAADVPFFSTELKIDMDLFTAPDKTQERITPSSVQQGIIPDIRITKDSTIKISGRKLVNFEMSKKDYPNRQDVTGSFVESSGTIDPKIDQETQVEVEGVIKDRIFIDVSYDDTKSDEDKEHISVVYKGNEDDIVREIALGDITLSLPGTELISFNRQLFGAKGMLSAGPFSYYALVTKEEGVTKSASFSGYSSLYQKNTNSTVYVTYPVMISMQQGLPGLALPLEYGSLFLYYDDGVYIEEEDATRLNDGEYYFEPMTAGVDYLIDYERGTINISMSMGSSGTVAAIFTDANGIPYGDPDVENFSYGEIIYTNRNEVDQQAIRDAFMLRNIYMVSGKDVDYGGITLDILDVAGATEIQVTGEDLEERVY